MPHPSAYPFPIFYVPSDAERLKEAEKRVATLEIQCGRLKDERDNARGERDDLARKIAAARNSCVFT